MHSISCIRLLAQEVFRLRFEADAKVFIVHDAERMLASSSNALLKTLDEPPHFSRLILLSSKPDALLPTVRSRCHHIPFEPVSEKEIIQFLGNRPNAKKFPASSRIN